MSWNISYYTRNMSKVSFLLWSLCQTVAIAWLMTRSVLWHVVNIPSPVQTFFSVFGNGFHDSIWALPWFPFLHSMTWKIYRSFHIFYAFWLVLVVYLAWALCSREELMIKRMTSWRILSKGVNTKSLRGVERQIHPDFDWRLMEGIINSH